MLTILQLYNLTHT